MSKRIQMIQKALRLVALSSTLIPGAALAQAIVPDPTLTPGSIRTTDVAAICTPGTRQYRHPHPWIFDEYGVQFSDRYKYTLDHLVPLELGGADDDSNVWPQPTHALEPDWNDVAKDQLENRLHWLVCTGQVDLKTAQQEIADDWTATWTKYVGQ
jgi:hypothetical protein